MLNLSLGDRSRNCEGVSRRDVLKVGTLAFGGMTVADLLKLEAAASEGAVSNGSAANQNDKAVICFWLDGGPSHFETFDPKPEAPAEYRGPFEAIPTAVPGVSVNELFPKTARLMDRLNVIRSVHHNNGDHFAAAHWMWTGYHGSSAAERDPQYPSVGAIAAKVRGPNRPGMPSFVSIPRAQTIGLRPGYQSAAFLGVAHNPFDAGGDPNRSNFQVRNLNLPGGVTPDRVTERKALLSELDAIRHTADTGGVMEGMDEFNQRAFEMITGAAARRAFDIDREDPRLRDKYGRNTIGQSALLARRLVEGGVRFVTVHSGGWDNHGNIERAFKTRHGPRMDAAIAGLADDLEQRGLSDRVMILVMGEFGRTPRINGNAGRDHWGNVMSVMLAGGGLQGGRIVGASDAKGTRPLERPVKPAHVLHTVYRQLGIDPGITHLNHAGRPIPVLGEGEPIAELI